MPGVWDALQAVAVGSLSLAVLVIGRSKPSLVVLEPSQGIQQIPDHAGFLSTIFAYYNQVSRAEILHRAGSAPCLQAASGEVKSTSRSDIS